SSARARPVCSSSPGPSPRRGPRWTGSSARSTCGDSPMVSNAPVGGGRLLSRAAAVAAALLGLTLLDAVRESSGRLADADDAEAYAVVQGDVASELRQVERRVRRTLIEVTVTAAPHGTLFAPTAARVVRAEATALNHALAAARSPHDQEAVHATRIVVKRLRYVLEWLASDVSQA